MRDAFTYIFKDPGFGQKVVSFCMVFFVILSLLGAPQLTNTISSAPAVLKVSNPFLNWLPFFGVIISFALWGYSTVCIKAITQKQSNIVLPFFNFKNSILRGLRFFFATLVYTLPLTIGFFMLIFAQNRLILTLLTLVVGVFVLYYFNALFWIYANEERLSSFFALKKATKYIKNNIKLYFTNLGLIFLINLLGILFSWISIYALSYMFNNVHFAWLATSLVSSIIATYIAFVGMYLIAKSIKTNSVV